MDVFKVCLRKVLTETQFHIEMTLKEQFVRYGWKTGTLSTRCEETWLTSGNSLMPPSF